PDPEPPTQVGEVGREVFPRIGPRPRARARHPHLGEMLERGHVFFAQGIAIVEAGRLRLGVPRAVEEQVEAARRRAPELRSEGEGVWVYLAAGENVEQVYTVSA